MYLLIRHAGEPAGGARRPVGAQRRSDAAPGLGVNFPETVFLLRAEDGDARMRILIPSAELAIAGRPVRGHEGTVGWQRFPGGSSPSSISCRCRAGRSM